MPVSYFDRLAADAEMTEAYIDMMYPDLEEAWGYEGGEE